MANRATIADVAEAAGVSVATVDRVLNGRHRVREHTARRVYEAATSVGYYAAQVIGARIQPNQPHYRLGILLQCPQQQFYQQLEQALKQAAEQISHCRVSLDIEFLESQTPAEAIRGLRAMAAKAQAIAITTIDHASTNNVVAELKERNIPVFTLLSDIAHDKRAAYVGVDNRKVGRTAAWLISKMAKRPGKVAIFVGSHRFLGHEMREIGYRTYFREHAPEFEVIDTVLNMESPAITHEATLGLLRRHPDLVGFYVAGGGIEGAISALREERENRQPVVVGNECTPIVRSALSDEILSMAIATPIAPLARELLGQMARAVGAGGDGNSGQTFLPFEIYTPENI